MTIFRPCIDLHAGQVKQIVGGTLSALPAPSALVTNHVSPHSAAHFAALYRAHALHGGHVIMLGPGNEDAARAALQAWPGGLQVGGGVTADNAAAWLAAGADKVIVTSYLFPAARFDRARLDALLAALGGDREKLVIDLSCRRQTRDGGEGVTWVVATNKWQTPADLEVDAATIRMLEPYCAEFLIHAADHEGLQRGIDEELVARLGAWCSRPVTYAGGGKTVEDLERVRRLSGGRVDLTIGSALDIFGGAAVRFEDCVAWNREQEPSGAPQQPEAT